MAKQVGFLKLIGTLGDISFYKTFNGYLARTKTGVNRKTVLKDPRFQRTRENASEFGRAAKAGKLLRVALHPLAKNARDSMMVQRLTQGMMKVLQTDTINKRGLRTVKDGNLILLNEFDFNINAKLKSIIKTDVATEYDRATGTATLTLHSFLTNRDLIAPSGSSHYKISFGAAALNFDALKSITVTDESEMLSMDAIVIPELLMTVALTPELPFSVVLVMGTAFYQEVNGEYFELEDSGFNSLTIVGTINF